MVALKSNPVRTVNSDHSILTEIWDRIRTQDVIRSVDMNDISVSAEHGRVSLAGHLSRASNSQLIEAVACSVQDVVSVNNRMVADDDLTLQVALALGRDARTRPLVLPVGCSHGWVSLGGNVPTRELQSAAEDVAAQVPAVRGVVLLPRLAAETCSRERRAVQPRLQATTYDHNSQQGVVTQVVVQPRNRLVSHAVVRTTECLVDKLVFHEQLVPVEAMEVVNQESIFLKRDAPLLDAFPIFEPADYPSAPPDWQPPYPYTAGSVRWPCEKHNEEQDQTGSSRLSRPQSQSANYPK